MASDLTSLPSRARAIPARPWPKHGGMSEDFKMPAPILWNPWNKVVQDHQDGTIYHNLTNLVRRRLGLPVPWAPEMAVTEFSNGSFIGKPY